MRACVCVCGVLDAPFRLLQLMHSLDRVQHTEPEISTDLFACRQLRSVQLLDQSSGTNDNRLDTVTAIRRHKTTQNVTKTV